MAVLGQVKIENSSLPVAVRVSKTRVLKLPSVRRGLRFIVLIREFADVITKAALSPQLFKDLEC